MECVWLQAQAETERLCAHATINAEVSRCCLSCVLAVWLPYPSLFSDWLGIGSGPRVNGGARSVQLGENNSALLNAVRAELLEVPDLLPVEPPPKSLNTR